MPFLSQEIIEEVNIAGYRLDNSKLNKIGNIRITPLKSLAIVFFVLALLLPQAVSRISDFSLYLKSFSAMKEIARAAEVSGQEKEIVSGGAEQKKAEAPKKKLTLADIWPGEFNSGVNPSNITPLAETVLGESEETVNGRADFSDIWPEEKENKAGLPRRLVIPSIKVSAAIQSVGLGQNEEMDVPNNFQDVGWFNLGSRPGERGSAVVAGHLNNDYGAAGVFWHLNKLKAGDDIYIIDEKGKSLHFKVSGKKVYSADSSVEEIFGKSDKIRLNLITCSGVWDEKTQNYNNRLVVSADLAAE